MLLRSEHLKNTAVEKLKAPRANFLKEQFQGSMHKVQKPQISRSLSSESLTQARGVTELAGSPCSTP